MLAELNNSCLIKKKNLNPFTVWLSYIRIRQVELHAVLRIDPAVLS